MKPTHADFFELKPRIRPGRCKVKRCRNESHPRKGGLCNRCAQQWFRFKCPKADAYAKLKANALKRGIRFTISYDYFLGLTDAFGYWAKTGDPGAEPSIDRVDACRGYEPGNLRVVSMSENAAKGNRERYLPEHVQEILRRKRERLQEKLDGWGEEGEDCPF